DEPAHYNYIAQVAAFGCCPVIEDGDWDNAYLETLKANQFAPDLLTNLPAVEYEDHQPPLYYLLLTPFYTLSNGSLTVLRIVTVFMALTVVLYTYIVTTLVMPNRRGVAFAAAAFVALLPQFLGITGSVNNDALAWSLIGLALIGALVYLRFERRGVGDEVGLGVLVGLALVTKVSTIFLLGVVPVAILLRWLRQPSPPTPPSALHSVVPQGEGRIGRRDGEDAKHDSSAPLHPRAPALKNLRSLLLRWVAFLIPALLIAGVWWGRNIVTYGFPDVFGLAAHDRVVVGQLRTADLIDQLGTGEYLSRAFTTTFQSFFGQLGWMSLPLPSWAYSAIGVLLLLAIGGWVVGWLARERDSEPNPVQRDMALVLVLVGVLALAQYIYYNTEFVQFQGRYMFTGIIAFALLVAGGMDGWLRWAEARGVLSHYARLRPYALAALILLLVPLNLWLLWRVIPGLSPGI
ncbi:MAG: DUF2142 domain-containing protein, partial [Chloroflexota bacterium]|nr:DUF2142 domain-containing protein [Chloroflexota bacterium]